MARTIQGKSYSWQLSDQPIGSGDAGEVYAVACMEQPEITGVVKKPARIATGANPGKSRRKRWPCASWTASPKAKRTPPGFWTKRRNLLAGRPIISSSVKPHRGKTWRRCSSNTAKMGSLSLAGSS